MNPPDQIFDPWSTCERMGVTIVRTRLRNARGYTDGHSRIWVHDGLTRCEERVALTHELCHIAFGHTGPQPPEVEATVRCLTARWLVPWRCLLSLWGEQIPLPEVAQRLCVTVDVLHDRIEHATAGELTMLEGASCASSAA